MPKVVRRILTEERERNEQTKRGEDEKNSQLKFRLSVAGSDLRRGGARYHRMHCTMILSIRSTECPRQIAVEARCQFRESGQFDGDATAWEPYTVRDDIRV